MSKSQSVERALDVLELIRHSDRPMGTREIARALELSPAIVQRILNTLAQRDYLRQNPDTRRYCIGYQALTLGGSLANGDRLLIEGRKELEEVTRKLRVDSYMATLQQRRAFYLLCLPGGGPVSVRCEPGQSIPLYSTAIGKSILASFSNERIIELLGTGPYPAITDKTITDVEQLIAEIELTRQRGYALVKSENIDGINSVGALIEQGPGGMSTAISLSYSPYFTKDLDENEAAAIITAAARRISRNILS